jgi:hypothetical protein
VRISDPLSALPIERLVLSPHGGAVVGRDSSLHTWQRGGPLQPVPHPPERPLAVAVSSARTYFLSRSGRLYSVDPSSLQCAPVAAVRNVCAVAIAAKGASIALISKDKIFVYDEPSGTVSSAAAALREGDELAAVAVGDGHLLACSKRGSFYSLGRDKHLELGREREVGADVGQCLFAGGGCELTNIKESKLLKGVERVAAGDHHSLVVVVLT